MLGSGTGCVRNGEVLIGLTSASGPAGARLRIGISAEAQEESSPTTPITLRSSASARAFARH